MQAPERRTAMNHNFYYFVFLASVFISAVSQIMLKKAAMKEYPSFLKQYLNPLVIGAYTLFFSSTVLTVLSYRHVPLSVGSVFETTSYLYITLFGLFIFHEKMSLKKFIAVICIVCGSILCAVLG